MAYVVTIACNNKGGVMYLGKLGTHPVHGISSTFILGPHDIVLFETAEAAERACNAVLLTNPGRTVEVRPHKAR